jgi:hypothetical protein
MSFVKYTEKPCGINLIFQLTSLQSNQFIWKTVCNSTDPELELKEYCHPISLFVSFYDALFFTCE